MSVTFGQFVESLTRTGLMPADEVRSFLDQRTSTHHPKDASELARDLVQAEKLTEYQARVLAQGGSKGLVLGDYLILDKLGAGGMGTVFKARHRRMNRLVALKLINPNLIESDEAVRRFQREMEAAAQLDHANLVRAYDAREQDGIHYLVMEYVGGITLSDRVRQHGPLAVAEAVDDIVQAARGLEQAHRRGIIHRDVKPQNLLLDPEGTVKVLDMGLARLRQAVPADGGGDTLTQPGDLMGSIDYMSPEQANDVREADQRSDLYSLGCTLYFLLTRQPVYPGRSIQEKLVAHAMSPIPALRASRPDVPKALDAVFRRMVAKRPEDRYPSMADLIQALAAAGMGGRDLTSGGSGTNAGVLGLAPPGGLPRQAAGGEAKRPRRRWLWTAGVAVLGLIAVMAWQRLGQPVWLPPGYQTMAGAKVVDLNGRNYAERIVRGFPDGTRVVFVLVPQGRPGDPPTFYMMENKVWNQLFRQFAHARPDAVKGWDRGSSAAAGGADRLPVLGVTVEEAHQCAEWLGGLLPTVKEWNKAAGLYETHRGQGPFRGPLKGSTETREPSIAIGRQEPLAVGAASRDVSPFGCHDMAGNGLEWTRDVEDPPGLTVPLPNPRSSKCDVAVRGNSFRSPNPLRYEDMEDSDKGGSMPYTDTADDLGFRVVIEPKP